MDNSFLLQDRIEKICSVDAKYNLRDNAYLSFSGGRDSTVLSALLDEALPGNRIPRVFINTGIEYNDIVSFVRNKAEHDDRLCIIKPVQNIKHVLETYGYPFKSKEHSSLVSMYQHGHINKAVQKYNEKPKFGCPEILKYQFTPECNLKISDACCGKLKKEPAAKWAEENKRPITITGMRGSEGGLRSSVRSCTILDKDGNMRKFHPLLVMDDDFISWYIEHRNIELCNLYYIPFYFKRTGCKGCPFNLRLQLQLNKIKSLMPEEYKQCECIWEPVYREYRRLGYRLNKRP